MDTRFGRHHLIPDWHQDRLANASVVVLGMGALGNEVTRILAMSGVGTFLLCDPDHIEESNLSRTSLFRASDVGRLKVDAAADALTELAPDINIQTRDRPLVQGVGLAELRDATLVIGCLDSRSARLQLAGRCQLVHAPYLDGGTHPWGGEVRLYFDAQGPCYGCSMNAEERAVADVPWSCLDVQDATSVGAAMPSSALVGTWMSMIAVRFLMGLDTPKGTLRVDGVRGTTAIVQQKRDPDCPFHMPLENVDLVQIGPDAQLKALRDMLPNDATILLWDAVQERLECQNCGYTEARWGMPQVVDCPNCTASLLPRTTLELTNAPEHLTLTEFGIPPREILGMRTSTGIEWIELSEENQLLCP